MIADSDSGGSRSRRRLRMALRSSAAVRAAIFVSVFLIINCSAARSSSPGRAIYAPRLFGLCVGINTYPNLMPPANMKGAVSDARRFGHDLGKQQGDLYATTHVEELV